MYFVSDPFNYSRNTSIQLTRDELNRANQENITTPSNIASNVPTRMQIEAATNTTTYSVIDGRILMRCAITKYLQTERHRRKKKGVRCVPF